MPLIIPIGSFIIKDTIHNLSAIAYFSYNGIYGKYKYK